MEKAKQEQRIATNEILDQLVLSGFDELTNEQNHQFHPKMLVKTSKKFEENFKNCSKVFYLHRNLILAVKDKTIEVFD